MSGLVLKLAPHERVLINGAVIENGARRGRLNILSSDVNILRLRDAIHPAETTTPVRRLCYSTQLVLSGDAMLQDIREELLAGIAALARAMADSDSHTALAQAHRALVEERPYYVLKHLRSLLPKEEALLGNHVSVSGTAPIDEPPSDAANCDQPHTEQILPNKIPAEISAKRI